VQDILVTIPFAPDLDLGSAYNRTMAALPEGGWACLLDHDATFTTKAWYFQLQAAINFDPDGTYTCVTNRFYQVREAPGWQARYPYPDDHDLRNHRAFGKKQLVDTTVEDVTNSDHLARGLLILVSKKTWQAVGGFPAPGLLGVDWGWHLRLRRYGKPYYCVNGLYLYHWYRADGDLSAFQKAPYYDYRQEIPPDQVKCETTPLHLPAM